MPPVATKLTPKETQSLNKDDPSSKTSRKMMIGPVEPPANPDQEMKDAGQEEDPPSLQ